MITNISIDDREMGKLIGCKSAVVQSTGGVTALPRLENATNETGWGFSGEPILKSATRGKEYEEVTQDGVGLCFLFIYTILFHVIHPMWLCRPIPNIKYQTCQNEEIKPIYKHNRKQTPNTKEVLLSQRWVVPMRGVRLHK
jgi:hypothetical protein